MSLTVAPGAPFEWVMEFGVTGREGTVAYKIDTGLDVTALGPITAGITELGTVGTYVASVAAVPGTAGQYVLLGSYDGTFDPDTTFAEQLIVTSDAVAAIGGTSNLYISAEELKASLTLTGTTFADDDVDLAIASACRAIDVFTGNPLGFFPTSGVREYSGDRYSTELILDGLVSLTSVTVDTAGDGTYADTWVADTDFYLDPPNSLDDGRPTRTLVLRPQAGRRFPRYARSIRVTGTFGWAETPVVVKQAAKILATRLVARRDVAFGIITAGNEMVAMARLGRIDPDVAWLLEQIPGASQHSSGLHSLQLG